MLLADNSADTLIINPINWKRDETYAKAEECISSLVTDSETKEAYGSIKKNMNDRIEAFLQ